VKRLTDEAYANAKKILKKHVRFSGICQKSTIINTYLCGTRACHTCCGERVLLFINCYFIILLLLFIIYYLLVAGNEYFFVFQLAHLLTNLHIGMTLQEDKLHLLAKKLIEHETLTGEEIRR